MKAWFKRAFSLQWILACGFAPALVAAPALVQGFEESDSLPKPWIVNAPNENATVRLSIDHPHDGKFCLKLHYRFLAGEKFQYLGVPVSVKIASPVHRLRYWIFGDDSKCSYGVQVTDASGETHQFSKNSGQGGTIDFSGWREVFVDLDAGHETWGGDKNGKIDYPISGITFTVGQPMEKEKLAAVDSNLSFDSLSVDSEKTAPRQIAVVSPAYCSDVEGDTTVSLLAPGFGSVTVKCWKQGPGFGMDSTVATVTLDDKGTGNFSFQAGAYPHGPLMMRISGLCEGTEDRCYLQLYNKGGVSWNEGAPKDPPPAAKGMVLLFADDFTGPLSISSNDPKSIYYDHKPGGGDFSTLPFSGYHSAANPFAQVGEYLRIRASEKKHSAGLISSLKNDGSGIKAKLPCYFECRFLGPNAIGTWPAFWLLSDWDQPEGHQAPCDELDIIEAYGGEGPHEPNAHDLYMITPHAWNQGEAGKALETKAQAEIHNPIAMKKAGIPSTWSESFHVYGCKITETDTIYYCDNIEVGRHKTLPVSKQRPFYFMINLATGGGWPVDLSRYGGVADMYVDYVRVYQQTR